MKIKSQQLLNNIFRNVAHSSHASLSFEALTIELLASYALTQH
jgi:hypothetical protein